MSTPRLSPAQGRLLTRLREFEAKHPEHADHQLVSGREYQSALALQRRGLATVRYQGTSMGWARALSTHADWV